MRSFFTTGGPLEIEGIYKERFNLSIPISQIMSKNPITCDLNTSVTELMDEMTEKKIIMLM